MDNVTHALAGCLIATGTVAVLERRGAEVSRTLRRAVTAVGIVAAELPDSDLVYAGASLGMGKLGYLLHHRGHTHTVVFAVLSAFLVWVIALALRRELRAQPNKLALLLVALAGTLSHLLLDYTNNYGIHPFWPISNRWFYGDAVFIIEPWLWIFTIPVLLFVYRHTVPRVLLAILLAVILAAAWFTGFVERDVATLLSVASVFSLVAVRLIPSRFRVPGAIGVWLFVESTFFVFSSKARATVEHEAGATYRAAAITPFVGNPLCFNAMVMEDDAGVYRVTEAVVAPASGIRPAGKCVSMPRGAVPGTVLSARVASASIRWGTTWSAPVADLRGMVRENCLVAAAMEFIRVPVWSELKGGEIAVADIRFGSFSGGFASITAPARPTVCPRFVPGWIPPRSDLLTTANQQMP